MKTLGNCIHKKNIILFIIFVILISGCTTKDLNKPNLDTLKDVNLNLSKNGDIELSKTYNLKDNNITKSTTVVSKNKKDNGFEKIPNFEKKYKDNLSLKQKVRKKERIVVDGDKVKISVESIPVNEFVDLIFSSVLKLNYTVSEDVKKLIAPITLNMTQTQPTQEVFDVVKKLLSLEGISLKKENSMIFISKKDTKDIKNEASSIYIGYGRELNPDIPDDEMIMMFIPYNHISPKKSVYMFQLSGISKSIYYYPTKNIQMLKNTAGEIRKAIEIVKLIDRPYLEGKTPYLVELKNIEVKDFINRMKTIFLSNGISVTTTPSQGGILMNSIPELNSIMVISPKQSWVDMIVYWKKKLDIRSEMTVIPYFYTYKVKNRKADELAKAINSIINIKLAPKAEEKKVKLNKVSKNEQKQVSKYTITSDLPTNTLMMQLLPSEYRELLPLIEQLDALPLQVLVEVTLAEVTMTDTFNLGFEYALKNNKALQSSPFSLDTGSLMGTMGGTGFGATYQSRNINAVINSYAEKKLLNILSKPKILILNNNTGNINVGSQVPVMTTESSSDDLTAITRSVAYQTTGVTVGLTPTINSNGILTMKINLNLSEAQLNSTSSIDSPLIINRTLSTVLTLKNNDTVLLGGLISTNDSITNNGVPLLMDIPWIGRIFQSESKKVTKTELLMLIKPTIIKTPEQIDRKTKKYKSIMSLLGKYSIL